jgi:hypothetical protein
VKDTVSTSARARRLLRLYPKAWRRRYGDEFFELLIADLADRPHCLSRTVDVVRGAMVARLNGAGLVGPVLDPKRQAMTSLAVLGSALALFLTFGVSVWAQLSIGWQWSAPSTSATTMAMITTSACVLIFSVLGVAAAVPIAAGVFRAFVLHEALALYRPLLLVGSGAFVLFLGSRHFANGWPGTGGHAWAHQGLVPGGVAAFAWASTLSVTSYWAHPSALSAFPPAEVVWMFISPFALCGAAVGLVKLVRRVDLSPRALRFETLVGSIAAVVMEVFLAAVGWWVLCGGPGPRGLFRTGSIDVAALLLMAGALVVALRTTHRGRHASLLLRSS